MHSVFSLPNRLCQNIMIINYMNIWKEIFEIHLISSRNTAFHHIFVTLNSHLSIQQNPQKNQIYFFMPITLNFRIFQQYTSWMNLFERRFIDHILLNCFYFLIFPLSRCSKEVYLKDLH